MNEHAVTVHQETAVEKPADLLSIIQKVVDGPLDLQKVEVLERLLAMQERVVAEQRKQAFIRAVTEVRKELKPIEQKGMILDKKGNVRSRFARYEDIDAFLKPLMDREGLSMSFNTKETASGKLELTATLSHVDGHSEIKTMPLPIDRNEYRNAIQDHGSTIAYGKRYLKKMHFDIIEQGDDTNGEPVAVIGEQPDLIRDLETAIADLATALAADKKAVVQPGDIARVRQRLLKHMEVDKLEDIRVKDLPEAYAALKR